MENLQTDKLAGADKVNGSAVSRLFIPRAPVHRYFCDTVR